MANIIVIYRSKYGTTQQYAQWIAEDTHADLSDLRRLDYKRLSAYDTVVFCGGLYAGGILGLKKLDKRSQLLAGKRLVVVAVGATLKDAGVKDELRQKNASPLMQRAELFLLRGGLDYQKMGVMDKLMMAMMVKHIKSLPQEQWDDDAKGILATYGKTVNYTNRKEAEAVAEAVLAGAPVCACAAGATHNA